MKFSTALKRFTKNIVYLCRYDLENHNSELDVVYSSIRHTENLAKSNMVFQEDESFHILNDEETWEKVLSFPKSVVRIGDGELALIAGKSIDFQAYNKRLAEYLIQILMDNRTDLYVGIDYNYFHGFDNVTETIRRHNYLWGSEFKQALVMYCNPNREYISSSFNQLYIDYIDYDWKKYLDDIRKMFRNKNIVVFAGKGILDGLEYNLFDNAQSCEYVWSKSKNAFDEFDSLLTQARAFPKDKILCFMLGPTSKPLVYELSKEGYMAWDLGHMAKDYDCCLKNSPKNTSDVISFFAPD